MNFLRTLLEMKPDQSVTRTSWSPDECVFVAYDGTGLVFAHTDSSHRVALNWRPSVSDLYADDWLCIQSRHGLNSTPVQSLECNNAIEVNFDAVLENILVKEKMRRHNWPVGKYITLLTCGSTTSIYSMQESTIGIMHTQWLPTLSDILATDWHLLCQNPECSCMAKDDNLIEVTV